MSAYTATLEVETRGRSLVDITGELRRAAADSGVRDGLLHVFIRHTSASLVVSENADPDVLGDLERFFSALVPDGDRRFHHDAEGPDDMPAHVRAVLTQVSVGVPLRDGRLALGTWQAVYLWEHRRAPHRRQLELTVLG